MHIPVINKPLRNFQYLTVFCATYSPGDVGVNWAMDFVILFQVLRMFVCASTLNNGANFLKFNYYGSFILL